MRKELKIQTIFLRIMWYDETIKNMAFQRDKVLGSCMTEDEEEAKMLNAILDELESFANAIDNDLPVEVSLEDGTEALKVALEIVRLIQK